MTRQWRYPATHAELNYLVSEETALRIRDFVQTYLLMDEDSVGRPNYSCAVHTIYLDSEKLSLYWKAINDVEHRRELRLRYNYLRPDSPVHFELKRRLAAVVVRDRAAVNQEHVPLLLSGYIPPEQATEFTDPQAVLPLEKFLKLRQDLDARPVLHIAFQRESYVGCDDERVRVTLDRAIMCEPHTETALPAAMENPVQLFPHKVLLELNYVQRFPDWFRELVRAFNLVECEADKYVTGISAIGQSLHVPEPGRPFPLLPFE